MYICFFCHRSSREGEKLTLVVTKTKPKTYPEGREGVETAEERPKCPGCLGTRGVVVRPVDAVYIPEVPIAVRAEVA